jgi:hypothetical protein
LCQRLSSLFVCFGVLESGCAVFCLRYLLVRRKKGPPMSCKFFFFWGPNVLFMLFVDAGHSCLVARWWSSPKIHVIDLCMKMRGSFHDFLFQLLGVKIRNFPTGAQ